MKILVNRALKGTITGLMGVAMLALLGGCGDIGPTSVAPDSADIAAAGSQGGSSFAFGPAALAKKVKGEDSATGSTQAAEGWFEFDDDGKLEVRFKDYGDASTVRVDKAKFIIREDSIDPSQLGPFFKDNPDWVDEDEVKIRMTVTSGTRLSDILVQFDPDGLLFSPAAKLQVTVKGTFDRRQFEVGKIPIYHISSKGTITKILADIEVKSRSLTIKFDVSGFSEYDWLDAPETH